MRFFSLKACTIPACWPCGWRVLLFGIFGSFFYLLLSLGSCVVLLSFSVSRLTSGFAVSTLKTPQIFPKKTITQCPPKTTHLSNCSSPWSAPPEYALCIIRVYLFIACQLTCWNESADCLSYIYFFITPAE